MRAAVRLKQLETEDPLVVQLAEDGREDIEYVEMLNAVESCYTSKLPENSEVKQLASYRDRLSVSNPITRTEIHFTHSGDETMWKQTKNKIFWPKMREDLKRKYETLEIQGPTSPLILALSCLEFKGDTLTYAFTTRFI